MSKAKIVKSGAVAAAIVAVLGAAVPAVGAFAADPADCTATGLINVVNNAATLDLTKISGCATDTAAQQVFMDAWNVGTPAGWAAITELDINVDSNVKTADVEDIIGNMLDSQMNAPIADALDGIQVINVFGDDSNLDVAKIAGELYYGTDTQGSSGTDKVQFTNSDGATVEAAHISNSWALTVNDEAGQVGTFSAAGVWTPYVAPVTPSQGGGSQTPSTPTATTGTTDNSAIKAPSTGTSINSSLWIIAGAAVIVAGAGALALRRARQ
jgi:LPXTG-motif cell wall-anchored protein